MITGELKIYIIAWLALIVAPGALYAAYLRFFGVTWKTPIKKRFFEILFALVAAFAASTVFVWHAEKDAETAFRIGSVYAAIIWIYWLLVLAVATIIKPKRRFLSSRDHTAVLCLLAASVFLLLKSTNYQLKETTSPPVEPPRASKSRSVPYADYVGKVVRIADGDSFTMMANGKKIEIRLASIDSPELDQPYGREAKTALSKLALGKIARVAKVATDDYGRIVGRVYVDSADVSVLMVAAGYAWVYRNYSQDRQLLQLEAEARRASRGLWADPNPIQPWEWRRKTE